MNDNRSEQSSNSTSVQSQDGTSTLTRLVVIGLAIGAGMILVKQLPDLRRYMKMKSM